MSAFRYLQAYPDKLQLQVQKIIEGPGLGEWLKSRHSEPHTIRTDGALYNYVIELKNEFLRQADNGYAPYGERSDDFVIARSHDITEQLLAKGPMKAVVVACNTATAVAIESLHPLPSPAFYRR